MVGVRYLKDGETPSGLRWVVVAETPGAGGRFVDHDMGRTYYWSKTDLLEDFDYAVTQAKRWAAQEGIATVYIVTSVLSA